MGVSKYDELMEEEFGELGVLEIGIVLGGWLERSCVMKSDSAVDMLLVARVKAVACLCDESSARKRIEKSILRRVWDRQVRGTISYQRSRSYIRTASLRLSAFRG